MSNRPDLYVHTLNQLLHGATSEELSENLSNCVEAVRNTGKQATLTLKLTVKPIGQGTGQYEIRDKITAAIPELDRGMTLMFGTPEGNLEREDPRQKNLELKAVEDKPVGDLKQA